MLENPENLSVETDSNSKVQRVGLLEVAPEKSLQVADFRTVQTFSKPKGLVTDAELADAMRYLYAEATSGMRKVIAFGLFVMNLQENHLKHGQLEVWCKNNVPDISRSAIFLYKSLTKSVLEKIGMQVRDSLPLCDGGGIMLSDAESLDANRRELRDRICKLIEGKSMRQLMLEFKAGEDDGNGELRPKVGRAKGEGGKRKLTEMEKAGQARERISLLVKDTLANMQAIGGGVTLLPPLMVDVWIAELSIHLAAAQAWQRQPVNNKQPELIYARFQPTHPTN